MALSGADGSREADYLMLPQSIPNGTRLGNSDPEFAIGACSAGDMQCLDAREAFLERWFCRCVELGECAAKGAYSV